MRKVPQYAQVTLGPQLVVHGESYGNFRRRGLAGERTSPGARALMFCNLALIPLLSLLLSVDVKWQVGLLLLPLCCLCHDELSASGAMLEL